MDETLKNLIHYATLAPSGHNTQPWKFTTEPGTIRIEADLTRRLPVVDPDDHALYISVGCAVENLVIAAAQRGFTAALDCFPADEPSECIRVRLTQNGGEPAESLFHAIPARQSNRRLYDGRPIPDDAIARLLEANLYDSVTLKSFRTGDAETEPIIEFVKEGNRAQFSDPAFVNELISWIRFSKREAREHEDGLFAPALGFPAIPRRLGTFIMTRLVTPEGEAKRQEKAIRSSSLLILFIAHRHVKRNWIDLGRCFQRVALTAASLGIAHAHVNMPCEVEPIRERLATHLGLDEGAQPLLLIRFGYGKPLPRSPRRPAA